MSHKKKGFCDTIVFFSFLENRLSVWAQQNKITKQGIFWTDAKIVYLLNYLS